MEELENVNAPAQTLRHLAGESHAKGRLKKSKKAAIRTLSVVSNTYPIVYTENKM